MPIAINSAVTTARKPRLISLRVNVVKVNTVDTAYSPYCRSVRCKLFGNSYNRCELFLTYRDTFSCALQVILLIVG